MHIDERDERLDNAWQRHFHELDRRSEAAAQYASLVINILCTLNGGAIIALVSFIGTRTSGHLWIGVLAMSLFGVAFALVVFGAVMAFHFNVHAAKTLSAAQLVPGENFYTYPQEIIDEINAANKIRMKGIFGVYFSFVASFLGFVTFLLFLLTLNPPAELPQPAITQKPPVSQPLTAATADENRPVNHETSEKRPDRNNDASSAETSGN